ncbi:ECF transporter S component [Facklamia miroungae]|uniref:Riboflavin transporter n=1 Tax=Facklamia miroungae TaxID=120956 RepID=A0A1G7PL72_9LACT|nr:ECF transporter S component [Facklamia miroungae]NKZ28757.1 ECF transporter S component [Facklamia miroungae]SDF87162.1 Riboflavin transporter FmnP [Facklamia miroungae]
MKNSKVKKVTLLAILGAWAVVLRFFDFPILPFAPFLKVDFSDLMALVGMLIYGPQGLIAVAVIRDLINFLLKGGESGIPIGMLMSLTATLAMFLPTHFILKYLRNKGQTLKFSLISLTLIVSLALSMSLFNYYFALPIYVKVMNFPIDDYFAYIMSVIIPFNLIKGLIMAAGQVFVIKSMRTFFAGRVTLYSGYLTKSFQSHLKILHQQ